MFSLEEFLNNFLFFIVSYQFESKIWWKTSKISRNKSKFRFTGIFFNIPRNLLEHSPESFISFPGVFLSIPQNF